MTLPQAYEDAAQFWEGHYAKLTTPAGGRPSAILVRFTEDLVPGRALDLGCARGDDTIWLARQGWAATGVDVAQSAIDAAQRAAEKAGAPERVRFARHDLNVSIPDEAFDLVSAMFLHSPGKFDRAAALQRAASVVAPGGLLLIAAHGSRVPWSWADPDTVYPTADEELADLSLTRSDWHDVFVGPIERIANGPSGQTATVIDTVIALRRQT